MLFNGNGGLRFSSGEANTSYWTLSVWIKRHKLGGNYSTIMSATNYGGTYQTDVVGFGSANTMFSIRGSNANSFSSSSGTAKVTDTSNWYHYCLRNNNGTVTRWLNGVQDSTYSVGGTFIGIGRSGNHDIGAYGGSSASYNNNFSLADFYFINDANSNTTYDWTQFAEFKNGVLVPKENSLTASQIGDGGIFLQFQQTGSNADASGIGADTSGNNHHASVIGVVADFCKAGKDTPTNNFCTWNPRYTQANVAANTFAHGNLLGTTGTSGGGNITGTFAIPSEGKWYFEMRPVNMGNGVFIGLWNANENVPKTFAFNSSGNSYILYQSYSGGLRVAQTSPSYGATFGTSDTIGVAVDIDNGTVTYYKNNSSQGAYNFDATGLFPVICDWYDTTGISVRANFGQDSTFGGVITAGNNADANGNGDFAYAPPTGHLALCAANLPEPAIGPNEGGSASTNHFNTILYTGNQTARSETGVGFSPDLVWIKGRNATWANSWFDTLRGPNKVINSDWEPQAATREERSISNGLNSFDADGFSLGGAATLESRATNNSGTNYVAWNWLAGGTPSATNSNAAGQIPTTGSVMIDGSAYMNTLAGTNPAKKLSANTKSGFSIVSYTGSSNQARTVAHGLTKAPEMVIVKNRSTTPNGQWVIGQNQSGFTGQMYFTNGSFSSNGGSFNNTAPSNTVVSLGTDNTVNEGTDDFIMYCFHSVEGFSKIGKYDGNGLTDGAYIHTGFRPAWVMVKTYNQNVTWFLFDNKRESYNGSRKRLLPSQYNQETGNYIELLSNGFKWISGSGTSSYNGVNYSYVYLAFAEQPFKYSNAGGR